MKIEKLDVDYTVSPSAAVRLKECGNIAEIRHTQRENCEPNIRKIDKNRYVLLRDRKDGGAVKGEILEFSHNTSRKDDIISVKESLARLRDYLNTNVTDTSRAKWITLTYAENMMDAKRLYHDFKAFNRKCRKVYGDYEYVISCEPQARGAWHIHAVLIFAAKAPFMANDDVRKLWGNGFVNIRALTNVDDIGRYLTAYLGDMTVDELGAMSTNVKVDGLKVVEVSENGNKKSKAVIKGARLALYPPGFHLYRISKGIKPPTISKIENQQAEERLADWALTYEATYRITDKGRQFENVVNKRFYNKAKGRDDND